MKSRQAILGTLLLLAFVGTADAARANVVNFSGVNANISPLTGTLLNPQTGTITNNLVYTLAPPPFLGSSQVSGILPEDSTIIFSDHIPAMRPSAPSIAAPSKAKTKIQSGAAAVMSVKNKVTLKTPNPTTNPRTIEEPT